MAFQVQHILLDFPSKEPGLFIGLVKQWGNDFFGYILADFLPPKRAFLNAPGPGMTLQGGLKGPTSCFPMDLGVIWPIRQILCRFLTLL